MRAIAATADTAAQSHLLVAGETVEYYDLPSEARALGIGGRVTFAGYLPDSEIDDYLRASDVCVCTRWPTSRETSASWLRCLAAGKPTISTDLVHTLDIPTLDPRDWSVLDARLKSRPTDGTAAVGNTPIGPVGVSIDILDEDHSLRIAVHRLATDATLRTTLGNNARALWAERFRLATMVAGYQEAIARALEMKIPDPETRPILPLHLRSSGSEHAESLIREILGSEYHLRDAD
jgi:glycosyltransferase involved in cell wall biosynthesis